LYFSANIIRVVKKRRKRCARQVALVGEESLENIFGKSEKNRICGRYKQTRKED
jgi:uncharacterized protein (DUF1810 family)